MTFRAIDGMCYDEEVDKTLIKGHLANRRNVALFRKHGRPSVGSDMYTGERTIWARARHWNAFGLTTALIQVLDHGVRAENGTLTLANGDTLVGT